MVNSTIYKLHFTYKNVHKKMEITPGTGLSKTIDP